MKDKQNEKINIETFSHQLLVISNNILVTIFRKIPVPEVE